MCCRSSDFFLLHLSKYSYRETSVEDWQYYGDSQDYISNGNFSYLYKLINTRADK